jgi:hypothetical protein
LLAGVKSLTPAEAGSLVAGGDDLAGCIRATTDPIA